MLKDRVKVLNKKLGLYVDIMDMWTDPILYIEEEGKLTGITIPSGAYEFDTGQFFLKNRGTEIDEEFYDGVLEIIREVADGDSFVDWGARIEFRLNKEHLEILERYCQDR